MEDIRAFIAIELPEEIKKQLTELETRLQVKKYPAKWVVPGNIHLTLKFLGDISVDSVPNIREVMEEAVLYSAPFSLGVSGVGVFPNIRRIQIIWAGVNGELDNLIELQKKLDTGLESLGFAPESRPFTAHLTLARMRDEASPVERETAGKIIESIQFDASKFQVEAIHLIKSELKREGPVYTRILSVPLLL
jgi:RNA 2',3'-cyclic 3'-phosphodiesterase